jgi:dTMP kinase
MSKQGKFIVLEGIDGAGTTTQTQRLIKRLGAAGQPAVATREPSDGPIGTMIRQMLAKRITLPGGAPMTRETLALLFAADRLDHVAATVEPALNAGRWVISDRYAPSSLVYQGDVEANEAGAERVDYSWIAQLNSRARVPDLTIFLRIELETSLERISGRAHRDLYETREKLARLVVRYDEVIALLKAQGMPVLELDGARSLDEVEDAIWAAVSAL